MAEKHTSEEFCVRIRQQQTKVTRMRKDIFTRNGLESMRVWKKEADILGKLKRDFRDHLCETGEDIRAFNGLQY